MENVFSQIIGIGLFLLLVFLIWFFETYKVVKKEDYTGKKIYLDKWEDLRKIIPSKYRLYYSKKKHCYYVIKR